MKRIISIIYLFFTCTLNAQTIVTFAGGGISGLGDGGPATAASFICPEDINIDVFGNFYLTEALNHRIRKIDPFGIITTIAGTGVAGFSGDSGLANVAKLRNPSGITSDTFGNVYFCDQANNRIRKIEIGSGIITTVAGNGTAGYAGDGVMASATSLNYPYGVYYDKQTGGLFISDNANHRVRVVSPSGIINTIAGNGATVGANDGGPATAAACCPQNVCKDNYGNLYISDGCFRTVRKVNAAGVISTIAGDSSSTVYNGDEIPATTANMAPVYIYVDAIGSIYIPDSYNNRVRIVDAAGIIHTVAGNGINAYSGDNGPATGASINQPSSVTLDNCGNLYIAQINTPRIRKVTFTSTPSATISISSGTIDTLCSGTAVTYTASTTGGGSTFSYQWLVNGAAVSAGSSNTYTYAPVNGDSINCTVTTSTPCSSPATASSNTIHTVVNPSGSPGISISASPGDTVCLGTPVTYTASSTNGGSSPAYQWLVNGVNVGTGASYTYTPANGDSVRCVLTSNAPCMVIASASSNSRHMVVNLLVTPAITVTSSPGDTICAGTAVTLTASITNGGLSPAYQWKVNGINAGTGGSSYSYTPANGDTVRCVLTSNVACATIPTVNSNNHHMVVIPLVTPTINISSSPGDTVCAGTPITFTASITGGGASPAYQWKVNGINAGTGASTYSYTPANGDTVRCVLTSNAACATIATVNSNNRHMVVIPLVMPAIFITPNPNDTVCTGTAVTYSAIITGGGASPAYQWVVNGANVGTGGSTYYYHPLNNDTVVCVLTSNAICASPAVIKSNEVAMVVDTFAIPTIALSAPLSAAIGATVNITATITSAGSVYTIYWMNSGTVFNSTSVPSVSYTKVSGTDTITAKIVPTGDCYDSTTSLAHVVFNANAGIQDVHGPTDIQLYPNPAGDVLYIMANITLQSVTITNLLGQVVYSNAYSATHAAIDIRELNKGIYFVKINNEKVVKFVKE